MKVKLSIKVEYGANEVPSEKVIKMFDKLKSDIEVFSKELEVESGGTLQLRTEETNLLTRLGEAMSESGNLRGWRWKGAKYLKESEIF